MTHSTKGWKFMNQEKIKVVLRENDTKDVLVFYINEKTIEEHIIDLNSTKGQNDLKIVFSELLKKLEKNPVELELQIDEAYTRGLYKEVFSEYIKSLNAELETVYIQIQEEIK